MVMSSKHSTWHEILHAAFRFTPKNIVTEDQWIRGLAVIIMEAKIECIPGEFRTKLSSRRMVELRGQQFIKSILLSGPPGSKRRMAMEAEERNKRTKIIMMVDLGYTIPFSGMPSIIQDGFDALQKIFSRTGSNQNIREHYTYAQACLNNSIGDPLCDLLFILVIAFSASDKTPTLQGEDTTFTTNENTKRKNQSQFAANMATRMLWHLHPEQFPWDRNDNKVLRVAEMVKKMEHKGVNNRMLCQMGWLRRTDTSQRLNPRMDEVTLRHKEDLFRYRNDLLSATSEPTVFFARIFGDNKPRWEIRCSSIVKEFTTGYTT